MSYTLSALLYWVMGKRISSDPTNQFVHMECSVFNDGITKSLRSEAILEISPSWGGNSIDGRQCKYFFRVNIVY